MNFQSSFNTINQTRRSTRVRLLILAAIAVFLAYEVTVRSVPAYLAGIDPETSLRLNSSNPSALVHLAQQRLRTAADRLSEAKPAGGETSHDSSSTSRPQEALTPSFHPAGLDAEGEAGIRSLMESALYDDPLNAPAFGILGRLSVGEADRDKTRTLMQAAVRRSLRESAAVSWMMQDSYERKDYRAALRYADVLLRTRPQFLIYVMPMLGQIAETEPANFQLLRLLANNPPWRAQFFAHFPQATTDARTPLNFLLALSNSPNPPSNADLASYLQFLVQHGFYDLAYYTWLQFLPPEQLSKVGRLFNGSFETESSGLAFDWVFRPGKGSVTKIVTRPGGGAEHALFMQFGPGRVEFPGVKQLVVLPPDAYLLKGKYKSDLISQRGLTWRITCVGGQKTVIGEGSPINGQTPDWKEFEVPFTVPESDCPAQYVELVSGARSASEKFISGSIWYDELGITRGAAPVQASE